MQPDSKQPQSCGTSRTFMPIDPRFKTRAEAKAAIFEYIEVFYNRQRRHSAIGYKTPKQAFEDMTWKMAT